MKRTRLKKIIKTLFFICVAVLLLVILVNMYICLSVKSRILDADETYLKEHETLMIYTPNQRLTYRIFTALTYDDRHIMGSFDFSDIFQREEYLASIGNSDPEVRSDSRIITLSTCIGGQPNNRLLVEAVLVNEE